MHNGVIADFIFICRDMCKLMDDDTYANISGSTDSEHLAALYITYLTNGAGKSSWEKTYPVAAMRDALKKAMGTVIKLQSSAVEASKRQANSLNVCASDGSQLVAFRCRNHALEQPPSLYYSTHAGVTLNRKYPDHPDGAENPDAIMKPEDHGRHVIVASEPSTYKKRDWELIEKNHAVLVEVGGELKVEEVTFPAEWNAEGITTGF